MALKKYNPTRSILAFISVFLCFMAAQAFAEEQNPQRQSNLFVGHIGHEYFLTSYFSKYAVDDSAAKGKPESSGKVGN